MPRWKGWARKVRLGPLLGVSPLEDYGEPWALSPPAGQHGTDPYSALRTCVVELIKVSCPTACFNPQRLLVTQGRSRTHTWPLGPGPTACSALPSFLPPTLSQTIIPFTAAHLCSFLAHLPAMPLGLCTCLFLLPGTLSLRFCTQLSDFPP